MKNIKFILLSIAILIIISLTGSVSAMPLYYKINLSYDKGNIEIKNIDIIFSQQELENNIGDYKIKIFDLNDIKKYESNFYIPNKRAYDEIDESGNMIGGGIEELDNVSFYVYVPYYKNAKDIIVYDMDSKELNKKDIGKLSKDVVNNENVGEQEKGVENEVQKTSSQTNFWYYILGILVILLIVVIGYVVLRKR